MDLMINITYEVYNESKNIHKWKELTYIVYYNNEGRWNFIQPLKPTGRLSCTGKNVLDATQLLPP